MIHWIPCHIRNAKSGDEDLLTEIQGIESLHDPLFNELVTYFLEHEVVHWLQVSRASFFLTSQMDDYSLLDDILLFTEMAEAAGRCLIKMDDPFIFASTQLVVSRTIDRDTCVP